MRPISQRVKKILEQEPNICARRNADCQGRITWEHAFIYAGKQVDEPWAIIKICWYHHLGAGLNKRENQRIAIKQATLEDLAKYPRHNWKQYEN